MIGGNFGHILARKGRFGHERERMGTIGHEWARMGMVWATIYGGLRRDYEGNRGDPLGGRM